MFCNKPCAKASALVRKRNQHEPGFALIVPLLAPHDIADDPALIRFAAPAGSSTVRWYFTTSWRNQRVRRIVRGDQVWITGSRT
jgi:hypothetical protein